MAEAAAPDRFGLLLGLVALALLAQALRGASWRPFASAEGRAVFAGATLAFGLLRVAHVETAPGLDLHFVGAAIATLMFGWRFGLASQLLAATLATLLRGDWAAWPAALLVSAALPVLVASAVLVASQRMLGRNPFAYIFGAAFAGGALCLATAQLGAALLAWGADASHAARLADNFLLTLPAMMFGEAFLSGGTLAILVSYRPRWVATFDDDFYLRGGGARQP